MSKLADAIRNALRREARPIGFVASAQQRNRTMLVLARVDDADDAAAAATAGADAVIVEKASVKADGTVKVWGSAGRLDGRDQAKALADTGADFLVFDDDKTDAAVLLEDRLGFVMRLDLDAEEAYLRTIDSLPLDALLIPGLNGSLSVRRTLDLRRLTTFVRRPLIMPVDSDIDPAHLEALRDCGVIGVVAEKVDGVAALRTLVDALPPRRRESAARGVGVTTASVASGGQGPAAPEAPDEDDEE